MRTVRHFFPALNAWIDQIDDPRFPPLVVYHKRFLVWWGLGLFFCRSKGLGAGVACCNRNKKGDDNRSGSALEE